MSISVTRAHPFDKKTARVHLEHLAHALGTKLKAHYQWNGDRLTFSRIGARGTIEVTEEVIHVDIRTSRLLPVSDSWLRAQVHALLDTHFQPDAGGTSY